MTRRFLFNIITLVRLEGVNIKMKTKKRIYCFPYAGGSSFTFRNLSKCLSYLSDVIVLDYPGHGTRFGEKFADNMEE